MRRATATQRLQVGVESVHGTAVAAGKRLLGLSLGIPNAMTPKDPFRPTGSLAAVASAVQKEHTEVTFEGALCYNAIGYVLSSLLKGTGAHGTYKPATFAGETVKSFSMEYGDSARADKWAFGMFSGLQLRGTRTEVSMSGDIFGQTLTKGATLTTTPTDVPAVLVDPKSIDIKIGADVGSLAAITDGYEWEWSCKGRWKPTFPFDSTQDSFSDIVAAAPELSAKICVEDGSEAAGYLDSLRAKTTNICQITATGPAIDESNNYGFQLTFPFEFLKSSGKDTDGVLCGEFDLMPKYDSTFGGWVEFVTLNGLGSL